MSQLTDIILKAGLLSNDVLLEMKRWGMPLGDAQLPSELEPLPTPASISQAIADAVESEGYILTRETDLEAIPAYLQTMQPAVLHVVLEDGTVSEFEAQVGHSKVTGDWIMPWRSDSITDLLTNGETYLRVNRQRIYFSQARELFYGENKAFVICTPSTVEPSDAGP